jgi:hypothetical protein
VDFDQFFENDFIEKIKYYLSVQLINHADVLILSPNFAQNLIKKTIEKN